MVFFDFDSTALSQQARTTLNNAATVAKSVPSSKVMVTGDSDTEGAAACNKALSLRRANAVKDELMRDGVPAQSITVGGDGKEGLLVPTPDQTRSPDNRRVEMVAQ